MSNREPRDTERGESYPREQFTRVVNIVGPELLGQFMRANKEGTSVVLPTEDEQVGLTVSPDKVSFSILGIETESGSLSRVEAEAIVDEAITAQMEAANSNPGLNT